MEIFNNLRARHEIAKKDISKAEIHFEEKTGG